MAGALSYYPHRVSSGPSPGETSLEGAWPPTIKRLPSLLRGDPSHESFKDADSPGLCRHSGSAHKTQTLLDDRPSARQRKLPRLSTEILPTDQEGRHHVGSKAKGSQKQDAM